MHDYARLVREPVLLAAAAVLVVVGVIAAVAKPDPHVSPAACTRRVADELGVAIVGTPSVEQTGDVWRSTVAGARTLLRVEAEGHRLTSVQLLAGPGADVLERPARLRALAVKC
ncbi:MAG: hypothetical protein V7636_533 [Actinomycetota bacterium]|jgi:hypothetical protein